MKPVARIYFKLSGTYLFRWLGEFTWHATGPVSSGTSEPLPQPTTIIGALLGSKKGAKLDEAVDEIKRILGLEDKCDVYLRGPYYPYSGKGVAVHIYPGKLAAIVEGRIEKVLGKLTLAHAGTGLDLMRRIAAKHLLYEADLLDPHLLKENKVKPELSVDVVVSSNCSSGILSRLRNLEGARRLGGEARVAVLKADDQFLLANIIANSKCESSIALVASPLLLPIKQADKARRFLEQGTPIQINNCKISPLAGKAPKMFRARIELLHPGVDSATGMPREPYLALLPGSLVRVEQCNCIELLRGLGRYRELGYGTLIPLREDSIASNDLP